jgi:hypothetical protein
MIRNLLRLLATSTSLALVLAIANIASAAPTLAGNDITSFSAPIVRVVSLNRANPSLGLNNDINDSILHQLGCSCASCTGISRQPSL